MQEYLIDKHFATDVDHFGSVVYMTPPAPPKTALLPIHLTRRTFSLWSLNTQGSPHFRKWFAPAQSCHQIERVFSVGPSMKSFQYVKVNLARAMQV